MCEEASQRIRWPLTARWLSSLLISVPLGGREVSSQLLPRAARTIAGRIPLNAPPLLERARIYRVEAELVEQPRDDGLHLRVVAADDQSPAVLA